MDSESNSSIDVDDRSCSDIYIGVIGLDYEKSQLALKFLCPTSKPDPISSKGGQVFHEKVLWALMA